MGIYGTVQEIRKALRDFDARTGLPLLLAKSEKRIKDHWFACGLNGETGFHRYAFEKDPDHMRSYYQGQACNFPYLVVFEELSELQTIGLIICCLYPQ